MAHDAIQSLRGIVKHGESMSRYTSWRVGGPVDQLFQPADIDDLATFLAQLPDKEPIHWIGLGSNLLVRDGGIRGTVIATTGFLVELQRRTDGLVYAQAGTTCAKLSRQCVTWGLEGADFFAGIPGALGGALAMNAGAFGGETWHAVKAVEVINRAGQIQTRQRSEYEIGYRYVKGPAEEWFIAGIFEFPPGQQKTRTEIKELLAKRNALQPIGLPSCGSVFRNPKGEHAARLIEVAGLKGFSIGGARVSEKHANFIINEGRATAADIEALMLHIEQTVEKTHGIRLEREVRVIGERRDD